MNILYVAPMFHTNQVPIMKGWLEQGHKALFVCHYKGTTENHSYCTPYVLGYSSFFKNINRLYSFLTRRTNRFSSHPEAFRDKAGFPSAAKVKKLLKDFQPDIVILRERSLYSIHFYRICRRYRVPAILYNQTPLWDPEPFKSDLAHKIVRSLTPPVRMTPVFGTENIGWLDSNAYYVPFAIEPHLAPENKCYFADNQTHLLCVGKFEERKNQLMLLELFTELCQDFSLHLTLVGEASTAHHKRYLQKITQFIQDHNLQGRVSIHANCSPESMAHFYQTADLFVLPSTGEFASVSQLEAMSYSLPVIVSDTNGTSCYVENAKTGYLFKDQNKSSLREALFSVLSDDKVIPRMGNAGYQAVINKYSFENYKESILQLHRLAISLQNK